MTTLTLAQSLLEITAVTVITGVGVAGGGGYPLLKSAITRRLQADGLEPTPLIEDADVVILVGGCLFDVMHSVNGHVCEKGGFGCRRQFECMVDAVGELSKRAAVLVLAEGNVGQISRILQAGARGYVSFDRLRTGPRVTITLCTSVRSSVR